VRGCVVTSRLVGLEFIGNQGSSFLANTDTVGMEKMRFKAVSGWQLCR